MKFLLILLILAPWTMEAQDLKKHQWKDRLIIVSSPTFDNAAAEEQLNYLKQNEAALKERKLVVYHVTNMGYSIDFSQDIHSSENSESEISGFNVALIGLDGTRKYQDIKPQKATKFFDLIDQMPMRQNEMKQQQ